MSPSGKVSCPSVTTTGADRLILNLIAHAVDTSTNPLSTPTNASLANIANRKVSVSAVGTGGGVGTFTGEKATAGSTGSSAATLTTASAQALITLSLKPPGAGTSPFGGFYVATGVKQTAGATGASTGNLQTAQRQALITISLIPPVVVTNNPPVLDPIPDLLAIVSDTLDFTVTASDPDAGDVLRYSLVPGTTLVPGNLTINATTGQIQWTPSFVFQGTWNVKVRVTDAAGLFDEQNVKLTVTGGPANARDVAMTCAPPRPRKAKCSSRWMPA